MKVDPFDAVEVHGDVGDVAGEAHPLAVGRDVDGLGDIRAVEQQGVEAGLTIDRVASVARVPDERVVARTQQRHVVAGAAVDEIVALAADQRVVAGAPLRVRPIELAMSPEALMVSLPAPPLTVSWSVASA
jgi:hypothetical protein